MDIHITSGGQLYRTRRVFAHNNKTNEKLVDFMQQQSFGLGNLTWHVRRHPRQFFLRGGLTHRIYTNNIILVMVWTPDRCIVPPCATSTKREKCLSGRALWTFGKLYELTQNTAERKRSLRRATACCMQNRFIIISVSSDARPCSEELQGSPLGKIPHRKFIGILCPYTIISDAHVLWIFTILLIPQPLA